MAPVLRAAIKKQSSHVGETMKDPIRNHPSRDHDSLTNPADDMKGKAAATSTSKRKREKKRELRERDPVGKNDDPLALGERPKKRQAVEFGQPEKSNSKPGLTHPVSSSKNASSSCRTARTPPPSLLASDPDEVLPPPPPPALTTLDKNVITPLQTQETHAKAQSSPMEANLLRFATSPAPNNTERKPELLEQGQIESSDTRAKLVSFIRTHKVSMRVCGLCLAFVLAWWGWSRKTATSSSLSKSALCFRNNVHSPVKYQGDCANGDPTLFPTCPQYALCFGGTAHDCRFGGKSLELPVQESQDYYQWESSGQQCVWTQQVNASFAAILQTVQLWTLAHACRNGQSSQQPEYPEAAWMDGPKPLFILTDVTQRLDESLSPPFNVRHPVDAFTFVSMVNDVTGKLSLSAMPRTSPVHVPRHHRTGWLGPRVSTSTKNQLSSKPHIPPGTPLVGLSCPVEEQKGWLPLAVQCWWYGMPRTKKLDQERASSESVLGSPEITRRDEEVQQIAIEASHKTSSSNETNNKGTLKEEADRNVTTHIGRNVWPLVVLELLEGEERVRNSQEYCVSTGRKETMISWVEDANYLDGETKKANTPKPT